MNLVVSGILEEGAKVQYLRELVHREALFQLNSFSADVEISSPLTVEIIINWLELYFPPVNSLSKQKRTMRCGMRKPSGLKVRRYVACLIDLNEYLASFPGATFSDKIGVTELNEILLNSMPNSWSNTAYV